MEISARRSTFRKSIRKNIAHIKAMLGELAPDPWQQSPTLRDVAHGFLFVFGTPEERQEKKAVSFCRTTGELRADKGVASSVAPDGQCRVCGWRGAYLSVARE
jgi:hypothetical protein